MRRYTPVIAALFLLNVVGCKHGRNGSNTANANQPKKEVPQAAIKLDMSRSERESVIIEYYRKPVMGRRSSLRDVTRVVDEVAPILKEAVLQKEVSEPIASLAADNGITVQQAQDEWVALQEADILLESGGDPEDVSSANAVGVAQWILETGRRAGLKVDLKESKRLTGLIDSLKQRITWMVYLTKPGSNPNAPGNPGLTPQQAAAELPLARTQLADLRLKRQLVDDRYDPRKALVAHTRYLLGLYPKFPDVQWIFQAFHGGEAGVMRTLDKYTGNKKRANSQIKSGNAGHPLHYEDVYFSMGPKLHPACFSYIFGRGDDHRHYWWKLRAAREAIALFRQGPEAFKREWEGLFPGRAKEAIWYPDTKDESIAGSDVEACVKQGVLLPVTVKGLKTTASRAAFLRPEALGLLKLVLREYQSAGGKTELRLGDTWPSPESAAPTTSTTRVPSLPPNAAPRALPGGGPPADFNFHETGIAFDLIRPADDPQRKVLEYALYYLRDRDILWLMDETTNGQRRYHVVPNPRFKDALANAARENKTIAE